MDVLICSETLLKKHENLRIIVDPSKLISTPVESDSFPMLCFLIRVIRGPIKRHVGNESRRLSLGTPNDVHWAPLIVATRATGGTVRVNRGIVEGTGGFSARLLRGGKFFRGGAALALGHVILARDARCLMRSREHERRHVRQYERWGPLLLPVYWIVSGWLRLRGLDPYLDHPLEPPVE